MSNGSARRALTDRHTWTHGTDFIPLIADAGGNKNSLFQDSRGLHDTMESDVALERNHDLNV